MKNIFYFFILFFLFHFAASYSQVQQEWVQRYNGPGDSDDVATDIAVDDLGNVYITGRSKGNGTGYDYATLKYNASGIQQWIKIYNGPVNGDDKATSLAVDGSGNVYITGCSKGNGTGYDYATIKYNTNGVQQWVQRYNGPGNDRDAASSIAVDGLGNVYVTGSSYGSGTNKDYATIKYNENGIQQWVQRYNQPWNQDDEGTAIAVDGSGNVYVTGTSSGNGSNTDYLTIKYNSSGVQQWIQIYNGSGNSNDFANSMVIDNSGNVYVTGSSYGNGTFNDYATIKYNTNGVQQWVQRYDGSNMGEIASSIAIDNLGNVYVTGSSWNVLHGSDYATLKYNSNGIQQWVQRYNGPGDTEDVAWVLALDNSGNIYVTGRSYASGTGFDYATVKYSQQMGIKLISSEIPEKFALYQNYPNPFNPSTKIKFDIPDFPLMKGARGMSVSLTIYDLLGHEITTLVNEQLKPGSYEVEFDGSNYPSGVFFYRLITGEFTKTMKMVLIK